MKSIDYYKGTDIIYPDEPSAPRIPRNATPDDFRKHASNLEEYQTAYAKFKRDMDKYDISRETRNAEFKQDLFAELDITNNPKREAFWLFVYNTGESFENIIDLAHNAVSLIK